MLKNIKIDNFKTFIQPTNIDFSATNYKFLENENVGKNRILKGALFVGENASGKTSILMAIKLLLDLLFSNKEVDMIYNKSFYTDKDTYKIEYTFIIDNKEIIYEFELGINVIIAEKLIYDKKVIIERLGNTAKFSLKEEKTFTDLSGNLLFLRRIFFDTNFYGDECLNKWFSFMKKSVYINCYDKMVLCYTGENNLLVHEYLKNNTVDELNKLLGKINYKQKIEYSTETTGPKDRFYAKSTNEQKFISFNKEGTDTFIPEIFESTGNKTLIELLPSFIHAINNDCIIILDEFSSGFHNELEECLLKYFFHYAKNSQVFLVSHSTNLLNNSLVRPDQVYSVYFDAKKGTILKRFSDEMPRESQNIEKMYLNGVFNGLPRYNKIFKD